MTGEVLLVPDDSQRVDSVVRHFGDIDFGATRPAALEVHPRQARLPEAMSFKVQAQRLGHEGGIKIDSSMLESGEGHIRESDQLLHAHPGVILNLHNVEVAVAWVPARPVDGSVLPGLDLITDELQRPPCPGQRATCEFCLRTGVFRHAPEAIAARQIGHVFELKRDCRPLGAGGDFQPPTGLSEQLGPASCVITDMHRSRRFLINLITGASLVLGLSLVGETAEAHIRAGSATAGVKRPSAHLLATLSGPPPPPAPSPNFTRVAASAGTVVAQGTETDVFAESVGGWRSTGPTASLLDPKAPGAGTGLSISKDTVVAGFGSSGARSVEDVFVKPSADWSGVVSPAARLVPPAGHRTLIDGVIAGRVIAAQTTDAQQPLGPVGVYVKPARGWSGTVRPRARLAARSAITGFGLAISSHTIFVSGRSVVYVFKEPMRGWSGTIKPSARLHATGGVSVAGTSVLVGYKVFSKPAHGWSGNVKPSATIAARFVPTDQASSPTTLITTSISTAASGCVTGCPAQVAAVTRPRHGWTGRLRKTTIVGTISHTEGLPVALSGANLFLTGGGDVRVYRLNGTSNKRTR